MFPRVMLSFGPALVLFLGSTPTVVSFLLTDCKDNYSKCFGTESCTPYRGGMYCKGTTSEGSVCAWDSDCRANYGCISSVCADLIQAGGTCEENYNCDKDLYCDTTCKKSKDNGESCSNIQNFDVECKSGYCGASECETDPFTKGAIGLGATLLAVAIIVPLLCLACCIGIIYMAFCKKAKPVVVQQVVAPQAQAVPMMAAPVQAQPVVAQVV